MIFTCGVSLQQDVLHELSRSGEKRDKQKKADLKSDQRVKRRFGIDHTTIQLEDEDYPKAASEH